MQLTHCNYNYNSNTKWKWEETPSRAEENKRNENNDESCQTHEQSSKLNQDILPLLGISFNYNLQSKKEANI
jgi:hypothetical protein